MSIWFWIAVVIAAALAALLVSRLGARSRVDPTQVSIDAAVAAEVKRLYAGGDKPQAVKTLRAATGLGLADAVRIADKLGAGQKPPTEPAIAAGVEQAGIGPDHRDELRSLVAAGRPAEAIRLVRQLTGMPRKDAKDYVDRL